MQFMRTLLKAVLAAIQPVVALVATGVTTTGVNLSAYDGTGIFTLHSAAATGTDPTMDVRLTHCDTTDGSYTDITGAAFAQVVDAAAAESIAVDMSQVKAFVKAAWTITGTTPSFTCGVTFHGISKGS